MSREVVIHTVKGFIAIREETLKQMKEKRDRAELKELEKADEPEDKG